MSERESQRKDTRPSEDAVEENDAVTSKAADSTEQLDAEVDSMLDEIDDVLEVNADEFVQRIRPEGWSVSMSGASSVGRSRRPTSPQVCLRSADFLRHGAPRTPAHEQRTHQWNADRCAPWHHHRGLAFNGGIVMAGDRRATMGNVIAQRDIEKVFPADDIPCRHRRQRRHRRGDGATVPG